MFDSYDQEKNPALGPDGLQGVSMVDLRDRV